MTKRPGRRYYGYVAKPTRWVAEGESVGARLHSSSTFDQTGFRFRNDDGSETTATWKAALNTSISLAQGSTFRIRFQLSETAGASGTISFPEVLVSRNGGAYEVIGAGDYLVPVLSSNYANGAATTEQLAGARSFIAGTMAENSSGASSVTLSNQDTEIEFIFQVDATNTTAGDTLDLRIYASGSTALNTYSQTPRVTVASSGATGAASVSLPAVTASSSGNVQGNRTGTAAIGLSSVTVSASGSAQSFITGTAEPSLSGVTVSASGTAAHIGSAGITLQPVTVSGEGAAQGAATGTAEIALSAVTVSSSGIAATTGTGSVSLPSVTVSAEGNAQSFIEGTGSPSLQSVTVSGAGVSAHQGTAGITLQPVTVSASGSVSSGVAGDAAVALRAVTVTASGVSAHQGTGVVSLEPVTVSGSGIASTAITGASEADLSSVAVSASGTVGDGSVSEPVRGAGVYDGRWTRPKWKKRKEEIRQAILEVLDGKPVEEVIETPPEEIAEEILDPRFKLPIRRFVTPDLTPVLLSEIEAIQSQLARMAEDDDEEAVLIMALAA